MENQRYNEILNTLKRELIPATGCTEPIAVAYAAARAKEELGKMPDKVLVEASGNIIKNVKSVTVPNTGGKCGIEAAVGIGIIAGDASKELKVIDDVTEEEISKLDDFLANPGVAVGIVESELPLDIYIKLFADKEYVALRVAGEHTNIVYIEKNGVRIFKGKIGENTGNSGDIITLEEIYEFSNSCNFDDIYQIIGDQIKTNSAIAEEGIRNCWGASIGRTILKYDDGKNSEVRGKAMAAAGSDARMGGCNMPVIINSGSGNQGLAASMPVIEYAKGYNYSDEALYRSLVFSNLLAIHLKASIGRLSAYCGAVSAGCAAVAGIAYMCGTPLDQIADMVTNCLAITSGIICDGAKPSCAAKISIAIESAFLAWRMIKEGKKFNSGEGIVKDNVESTICAVSEIAKIGMKETDRSILKIMTSR